MKKAIITGITGQDGAYLAKLLLDKGYKVYGAQRRNTGKSYWRLDELGITNQIEFVDVDLMEPYNIERVLEKIEVDEFYNLAAQSFVALSFEQPQVTTLVNSLGVLNILEAIRHRFPHIKFNHESRFRGEEFVTRKITKGIVEYSKTGKPIELGNLDAKRDWGHAQDYVEAMWLMLQQDKPDDYVISTGQTHTVREFIRKCLDYMDIPYKEEGHEFFDTRNNQVIVKTNPKFFRPAEVDLLIGDCTKAKEKLGWTPKHDLGDLIRDMIGGDLERYV